MRSNRKGRSAGPAIVDANLLPGELRPGDASPLAVAIAAALLLAVLLMVPLSFMQHTAKEEATTVGQQANDAVQAVHEIELTVARKRSLQAQLDDTEAKTAALRVTRERLQGGRRPLGADVAQVLNPVALPLGARIVSVSGTDHGLRVNGIAAGPLDAISYAQRLSRDGGFTSARMVSFAPATEGGQFTIEVVR